MDNNELTSLTADIVAAHVAGRMARPSKVLLAAAALAMAPAAASAQNTLDVEDIVVGNVANITDTTTTTMDNVVVDNTTTTTTNTTTHTTLTPPPEEDREAFQWGLFGLFGLAGLFGRKKRKSDVRVDNRTDRP